MKEQNIINDNILGFHYNPIILVLLAMVCHITIFLSLSSSVFIYAQNAISGKVVDAKTGKPVPGVSIKLKSSGKGTVSNNEGEFKLAVRSGDVLEFSEVGYKSQTFNISNQTDISILLEQSSTDLGEVVVTGNRGMPRVKTESPVPVDIIHLNNLEQTQRTWM